VRTVVLSDLHLGSRTDADVLRRPEPREALVAALRERRPQRLVLLGDALELRHGPVADALDAARPVLQAIAAALEPDAEVVLLAGNHDHALVAPWLERRALERAGPLALEERAGPAASPATEALAEMLRPLRLDVAYPGVWLRPDVYATHGHYLDRHITVPTFERLASGAMTRVVGRMPDDGAGPEDYEGGLAPLYAWLHVVARHARTGFGAKGAQGTQRAWRMLTAKGPRPLRHRAVAAAFPAVVGLINRCGIGPVHHDVSPVALRRAGLQAMGEVCRRLAIDAEWVIFGHTHRAGPLPGDDEAEWRTGPGGTGPRLVNAGCWVHEEGFLGPDGRGSPYWPGTIVELDDTGPPRLTNILA
jgi:hypothetical protein